MHNGGHFSTVLVAELPHPSPVPCIMEDPKAWKKDLGRLVLTCVARDSGYEAEGHGFLATP